MGSRISYHVPLRSDDLKTADDTAGMCVQSAPASLLRSCTRRVPAREQALEAFARDRLGRPRPERERRFASEARERDDFYVMKLIKLPSGCERETSSYCYTYASLHIR